MNLLNWLNAQPWVRPALGIIAALAMVTKQFAAPHTIAYQVADKVLDFIAPLAAASMGATNDPVKTPADAVKVLKSVSK